MDPVTMATMASSVGTLASGLSGLVGGGPSNKDRRWWDEHNTRLMEDRYHKMPSALVYGAKQAGLHPLALLGGGFDFSGPFQELGGGSGSAGTGASLEKIGKGVAGLANAEVSKEMADLGLRQARAEVRTSEIAADQAALDYQASMKALEKEAAKAAPEAEALARQDVASGQYEVVPPQINAGRKENPGIEAGPPRPSQIEYRRPDGSVAFTPQQELKELELQGYYEWAREWLRRFFGVKLPDNTPPSKVWEKAREYQLNQLWDQMRIAP